MSTPYTIQENKEANLQFIVSDCQSQIEHIKLHMSLIENTLSFTGLSPEEMRECELTLSEYRIDLAKAQSSLDEALDNLLGQSEDEPQWWEQEEESKDFWNKLLE
jgi:hypothetical protein